MKTLHIAIGMLCVLAVSCSGEEPTGTQKEIETIQESEEDSEEKTEEEEETTGKEAEKPDDRTVLTDLFNSTNGNSWSENIHWNTDKPLSKWHGVTVNTSTDRVTTLWLTRNNLTGTLPPSIGNLSEIDKLYLSYNNLSGAFPASLSELMDVETGYLHLQGNKFDTEAIPEAITGHPNWKHHWLSFLAQNDAPSMEDLTAYNIDAPDFTVTDIHGSTISSEEEYARNKLTIIYRWNQSSNSRITELSAFYKAYASKGLNIIGYDHNCENKNDFCTYIADEDIGWSNFISGHITNWIPEFAAYNTFIPHFFVVDENRKVISHGHDVSQLSSLLAEKLGTPDFYTSTDYSQEGEVFVIQEATAGKGIHLIFMGEGFVDKDMAEGGKYETYMKSAAEQLFEIEPYHSLRNRFTVYGIKAVSKHDEFLPGAIHRFEHEVSWSEANKSAFSLIDNTITKGKLPDFTKTQNNMMAVVVYNTEKREGRSSCSLYSDGSFVA